MVKEEGHHGMSVSSAEHYVTKSQCGSKFPYGDAKFKFGCVPLIKPLEKQGAEFGKVSSPDNLFDCVCCKIEL